MARIISIEEWQEILALKYDPYRQQPDLEGFAKKLKQLLDEGVFDFGRPRSFYLERCGIFAGERLNTVELFFVDRQSAENFIKARKQRGIRLLRAV